MDIDGIKEIAEIFRSLGAEGKEAFIWWLVMSYGVRFLTLSGTFLLLGFGVVKPLVLRGISNHAGSICRRCYEEKIHRGCTKG